METDTSFTAAVAENPRGICGSSVIAEGQRRIFIFQSPLSFFEFFQSASNSTSGASPNPLVYWDDTSDLSKTASIPRISNIPFNILCHIGIVVIDDRICADTSLTLIQKLLAGKIYEHSGPGMKQAKDAVGRAANTMFVRRMVALEFVGYTNMGDPELDSLLQELVRADGALDSKPPYQALFWNCHDIACRFAFLATIPDADITLVRKLSGTFERAKLSMQRTLHVAQITGTNLLNQSCNPPPISPEGALLWGLSMLGTMLMTDMSIATSASRDFSERTKWVDTLKQRFPRLNYLNDVANEEWDQLHREGLWGFLRSWWD